MVVLRVDTTGCNNVTVRVQVPLFAVGVRRSQDIINEAGAGRSCAGRSGACRGVSSQVGQRSRKADSRVGCRVGNSASVMGAERTTSEDSLAAIFEREEVRDWRSPRDQNDRYDDQKSIREKPFCFS